MFDRKKYNSSPERKKQRKEYDSLPHVRERRLAYNKSERRKAYMRAYKNTEEFRNKQKAYRKTVKGKEASRRKDLKACYGITTYKYNELYNFKAANVLFVYQHRQRWDCLILP